MAKSVTSPRSEIFIYNSRDINNYFWVPLIVLKLVGISNILTFQLAFKVVLQTEKQKQFTLRTNPITYLSNNKNTI